MIQVFLYLAAEAICLCNPRIDVLRNILKLVSGTGLNNYDKLITAISAHKTSALSNLPEHKGHLLKYQISHIMTICIIIMLEVVQVNKHKSHIHATGRHTYALFKLLNLLIHTCSVVYAGQHVCDCCLLQTSVHLICLLISLNAGNRIFQFSE